MKNVQLEKRIPGEFGILGSRGEVGLEVVQRKLMVWPWFSERNKGPLILLFEKGVDNGSIFGH